MKLLVLSDSHSGRSFMRLCISKIAPDVIVHLGDYASDGEVIREEYPDVTLYQVPGNCDYGFGYNSLPEVRQENIGGVRVLMTHGHKHWVKNGTDFLIADGRRSEVQLVLYGHTHIADCHREEDGLWVMNPGACGSSGGSVGLIEIQDGVITECKILHLSDLEEIV